MPLEGSDRQIGYLLSIDLGTATTTAVLRAPDGAVEQLLTEPSGVFLDENGQLHGGLEAQRLGVLDPARYEPYPKQHIDAPALLLGGREVPLPDALAADLVAAGRAAVAATGVLPPVVLTYPAAWGEERQAVLRAAAVRAGFPPVKLVPEQIAAAHYVSDVLRRPVPVGDSLAILDFGAGSFSVAVVRRDPDGMAIAGLGGAADLGGLDIDAAIVEHLGARIAPRHPEMWQAVVAPEGEEQLRTSRLLWEAVREAKEALTRTDSAPIGLPRVATELGLTREELDRIAMPLLDRVLEEAARVVAAAGSRPSSLFLLGEGSRLASLRGVLQLRLGLAPTMFDDPSLPIPEGALAQFAPVEPIEMPVAVGVGAAGARPSGPSPNYALTPGPSPASLVLARLAKARPTSRPMSPPVSPPPMAVPSRRGPIGPVGRRPRRFGGLPTGRGLWVLFGAGAAVVVLLIASIGYLLWPGDDDGPAYVPPPTVFTTLRTVGDGTYLQGPGSPTAGVFVVASIDRAFYAHAVDKSITVASADLSLGRPIWGPKTYTTDRDRWTDVRVAGARLILVGTAKGRAGYTVVVVDGITGAERWRFQSEENYNAADVQFTAESMIVAEPGRNMVRGFDADSGIEQWNQSTPGRPRIDAVLAPGELNRATNWDGGFSAADVHERTLMYLVTGAKVTVLEPDTGKTVENASTLRSSPFLHLGVGNQLYVATTGHGRYQVRRADFDRLGDGMVLATRTKATVRALALCGAQLLCVLDGTGRNTEVAAFDAVKGGEAWRSPAPNATRLTTVGDRVLATDPTGATPVSYLFDPQGHQLLEAGDQRRLAVRASATGLLVYDKRPVPGEVGTVMVRGVDPTTGHATPIGALPDVVGATCSWAAHVVTCAEPGPKGPRFTIWRFAA